LQAGRISLSSYANKDAASFFTDAIKCTEKVSSEDTLELIGAERKLGICYYNLGQLSRADEHLRKALDLMGITIGNDPKAKGTKAVSAWKYTKQKELKQPDELIFRKREAVLLLLQLAKVNLYDCNKAVSWQCSSFALALSSEIGQAEYAEALSLSAITAEMNGESSIADQHIAKAVEAAGKQLDVLKKVLQISGMVYSGRGDFEKANDCLVRARDAATTIGDLKSWEETSVLLGTLYFLKGQIAESTEITEQVLDSARERGDLQSQVLALNAQARNYYALGDVESCWRCLEDVNIAFETLGASDVSAKMDYFALNALVRARVGDFETTWKIIVTNLFDQITKADVTPYFTIFAISDTIDATISLLSNPHVWVNSSPLNGKITKSKMQSKAEKLITFLGRFASIYAIAQPRLELFKGMFAHSKGKSFEKELTKGIEKAKAMGMIYDYACGIHDKGSFSNNPALTKQALDIYPELASRGKDWTEHKSLVGARKAFKILGD
jgi:tetratricopeptide (TPR) repeat protein